MMSKNAFDALSKASMDLTLAVRIENPKAIGDNNLLMSMILSIIYQNPAVHTVLTAEKIITAQELNRPPASPAARKDLQERFDGIESTEKLYKTHIATIPSYHAIINDGNAGAYANRPDGTAQDTVRTTLEAIRKAMREEIKSQGANQSPQQRACNIMRYNGARDAERLYIMHQHQGRPYASTQTRDKAMALSLKSFDVRMKREQREMFPTP